VLRPQLLAVAPRVVGDHGVGSVEDRLARPIVLLELDDLRAGEQLGEPQDVGRVGAAPAVDRLVVVADDHQVLVIGDQVADQAELRGVGVLELVDEHEAEPLGPSPRHVGGAREQPDRLDDQIVEVERRARPQHVLVARIDQPGLDVVVVGGVRPVLVGADERVLGERDPGQQRLGVESAVAVVQRAHRFAHRAELIRLIVDRKAARQAEGAPLDLQDLQAQCVKRSDRELADRGAIAHQRGDALAHLRRGLVGERHGADRARRDAEPQQVCDPVRDHAGLARASAGEHEQRPAAVARRLALRRIELAEIDHERCTLRI
jgi:hypothetical protein